MSTEAAKVFFHQLEKNDDLRSDYKELIKGIAQNRADERQAMSEIVQFAATEGYDFSVSEIEQVVKELKESEINDSQLDSIVAGNDIVWVHSTILTDSGYACIIVGSTADGGSSK